MYKILHVNDTLGGEQSKSWVEHFSEIAPTFRTTDHWFFILRKTSPFVPSSRFLISNSTSKWSIKPFIELVRYCRSNSIRVLQPHTQRAVVFSILVKLLLYRQVTLVVHEHGAINYANGNWYPFMLNVFSFCIKHIIAVSIATRKKLLDRTHFTHENVSVIYNFVDTRKFDSTKYSKAEAKKRLDVPQAFTLGFVGRLNKVKNLETLIKALPKLRETYPNLEVLLAGGGPEEYALKALVSRLKLDTSVHFLGKVDDMPALYAAFDINVLISHDENLSKVLLEATSMHVYSIVSDVGGNAEVIDGLIGRVLPFVDTDHIVSAVNELVNQSIDPAAFDKVLEKFSIDNHITATESLYESVLQLR